MSTISVARTALLTVGMVIRLRPTTGTVPAATSRCSIWPLANVFSPATSRQASVASLRGCD